MKKIIISSALAFLLGAAGIVFVLADPFHWSWLARARTELSGLSASPAPARPAERKIKYWRAPMDPTYIRDKPGKSPMGMDLVPVYEDDAGPLPPGTVQIDPGFVQNIGVQSEPVRRTDIPFTIRTVATLTYDDSQAVLVNTKYEGWIEKVYVNYVGQQVQQGQKLFEVYSPQLVTTQNEYLQAVEYARRMSESGYPDSAARARALVASARERLRYWDITDEQIADLEQSRQVRRTLSVTSPATGLVVEKMNVALEGMFVTAGMNLYKIVNLSTIWAEAEVYEHQVPWLRIGQRAVLELPYEPGRRYVGRIRYLLPYLSDKTRTLKVSIELPNPGQKLRADMYANVTFDTPSARGVLAVPEDAVLHSGTRDLVVLARGGGTFQVREVTLGVNGNGLWEVRAGVEEGDQVVVSAQFLISSESSLKEAFRQMTGAPEPPAGGDAPAPAGAGR
ncbi:MAG: efflux RND transporter periplasmic adaptor subunit [Deltaproteobacteria bacterium]